MKNCHFHIESTKTVHSTCISCIHTTQTHMFVGAIDGSLKFWKFPFDKTEKSLIGHRDLINVILPLKDGTLLTASDDGTLIKWDLQSCVGITKFVGHEKAITCCLTLDHKHLSPSLYSDGDYCIVSGSWDKTIRLWNPKQKRILRTLNNHSAPVSAMTLFEANRIINLASGSINGELFLWDLKKLQPIVKVLAHSDKINSLYTHDGKLMSSGHDNLIKVWNENIENVDEIGPASGFVKKFFVFRKNFLIFSSGGKNIELWNIEGKECVTKEPSKQIIFDMIPHEENRVIVANGKEVKILRHLNQALYVLYAAHQYRVKTRTPPFLVKEIYDFIIEH